MASIELLLLGEVDDDDDVADRGDDEEDDDDRGDDAKGLGLWLCEGGSKTVNAFVLDSAASTLEAVLGVPSCRACFSSCNLLIIREKGRHRVSSRTAIQDMERQGKVRLV